MRSFQLIFTGLGAGPTQELRSTRPDLKIFPKCVSPCGCKPPCTGGVNLRKCIKTSSKYMHFSSLCSLLSLLCRSHILDFDQLIQDCSSGSDAIPQFVSAWGLGLLVPRNLEKKNCYQHFIKHLMLRYSIPRVRLSHNLFTGLSKKLSQRILQILHNTIIPDE